MNDPAYLERQTAIIPLTKGLDLKTDAEVTPPASLISLTNASFFNPGAICKDDGYLSLTSVPANISSSCERLVEGSPAALLAQSYGTLYEYQDVPQTWRALTDHASPLGTASGERLDDARLTVADSMLCADYACSTTYEAGIYAQATAGTVLGFVREISTGSILAKNIANEAGATNSVQCYVLNLGTLFFFVWSLGTTKLRYSVWNPATNAVSAAADLVTDVSNTVYQFDAIADISNGNAWVAYTKTGGGVKLVKFSIAAGGTATNLGTITDGADTANRWVALGQDASGNVLCAYQGSVNGTKMFGCTSAIAARSSSTIAAGDTDGSRGTVVCHNGGTGMAIWEKGTGVVVKRCLVSWAGGGGAASTIRTIYGQTLTHRAFTRLGTEVYVGLAWYETVASASSNQRTLWTACISPGDPLRIEPVCFYLYDIVSDPGHWTCSHIPQCSASSVPSTFAEYRFIASVDDQKTGDPVSYHPALVTAKVRLIEGQAASVRGTPCVAGQLIYSGPGPIDSTFGWAPTLSSSISYSNVGGSGLVAGQTYQWQAFYELRTPDGTVVRSIPSNTVSGTVSGGNNTATLTVTLPVHRQAWAGSEISSYVRLTRTQAGPGATFTLTQVYSTATVVSAAAYTATLADGDSDASIASNELLYTTGGVLEAYPWPMGSALCVHQNRLFTINELSSEIRYTRDIVEGEAPCWHPNLAIEVSGHNIDPRALVSTSNGLVILGRDKATGAGAAAILIGNGPDDTGASSGYEVQRIEGCDVGPTHWRKAVATPMGVMFEDPYQGFHVLPAGGGVAFGIGLPAEMLRTYPVRGGAGSTLAMHVLQDRKEVRCLLPSDSISIQTNERMLVYHYDVGAWSERYAVAAPLDATVWRGVHIQVNGNGGIARHQLRRSAAGSTFADSGQFYPLSFRTGWIYFAGNAGQQQVYDIYLVGKFQTAVGLQVNLYFDEVVSPPESHIFSGADLTDNSSDLRLRIRPAKRRMERFQVEVLDFQNGTDWEGIHWNAIRVEYGVLNRGRKTRTTALKG